MGAAIVTLEDGVVAIGAGRHAPRDWSAAVTTNDLWHLGSNTKAITALLAAVAVSQNRNPVDDDHPGGLPGADERPRRVPRRAPPRSALAPVRPHA
jgi:CubicO group peptidase (beta-lactamase class C family)